MESVLSSLATIGSENMKNSSTIALIGNGFDLAHGLRTDYMSFVKHNKNESIELFKYYCQMQDISSWTCFEDCINTLSLKLFQEYINNGKSLYESKKRIQDINTCFMTIRRLLMEYLKTVELCSVECMESIQKTLTSNVYAINFNYTKTAELYTDSVFYPHGSIQENDIVLGYDCREEPCIINYEYSLWRKDIWRLRLAFARALNQLGIDKNHISYHELIKAGDKYLFWKNTGRGVNDHELEVQIPYFDLIDKFFREKEDINNYLGISLENVETILVIGHSISSDKKFLNDIVGRCRKLKEVIIYRYYGEENEEFMKKLEFFKGTQARIGNLCY